MTMLFLYLGEDSFYTKYSSYPTLFSGLKLALRLNMSAPEAIKIILKKVMGDWGFRL